MARTGVKTREIEDGGVQRDDLNSTTPGQAVIKKLIAGTNLVIENSTGVDEGTGDVTIGLENTQAYAIFPVWAEENGGLSNNNNQWSFGNGSTGNIGVTMGVTAEAYAMTLHSETGGTNVSIELMKDGVPVTSELFTGAQDVVVLQNPIEFVVGERVGFRTDVETGAYTDARVCVWFRIRASLLGSSILNDILDVDTSGIQAGQVLIYNGTTFVPFELPDTLDRYLVSTVTNSTTNVANAAYANAPVFGSNRLVNDDGSFTVIDANQIQINFDGDIEANLNIAFTSNGARATPEGRFAINGTLVGPAANTGYIRSTTGHNESSHHLAGTILQVSNGDILSYQIQRESTNTSSITMQANQGQISIRKVKS